MRLERNKWTKGLVNKIQKPFLMEKLARCQYLKNRDPKACALLCIALNRLQILAGLFKISKDERDKPLVAFISRNFQTLGDEQLALVICRLIEEQGGSSERHLISKILLHSAIEKGDYWLASVLEAKIR